MVRQNFARFKAFGSAGWVSVGYKRCAERSLRLDGPTEMELVKRIDDAVEELEGRRSLTNPPAASPSVVINWASHELAEKAIDGSG